MSTITNILDSLNFLTSAARTQSELLDDISTKTANATRKELGISPRPTRKKRTK